MPLLQETKFFSIFFERMSQASGNDSEKGPIRRFRFLRLQSKKSCWRDKNRFYAVLVRDARFCVSTRGCVSVAKICILKIILFSGRHAYRRGKHLGRPLHFGAVRANSASVETSAIRPYTNNQPSVANQRGQGNRVLTVRAYCIRPRMGTISEQGRNPQSCLQHLFV
jgi:hypothetical protein